MGLWDTKTSVWIPAPLLSNRVASGKSLNLSRPPFSQVKNGEFSTQPLRGGNERAVFGAHTMLGGPSGHLINICPSRHKAVLVTGMQLSLHSLPPVDISPWAVKTGSDVPRRTMGTWSPITTQYLSPDGCGTWPNKDVKTHTWPSPTHHTPYSLGMKQGSPGAHFLSTYYVLAFAHTQFHFIFTLTLRSGCY